MSTTELNTTFDYMKVFAGSLSERILSTYRPLHGPGDVDSPLLENLMREPLPAQRLVIMATAKYLRTAKTSKVVGECGTGKTLMALASCYVHADGKQHTGVTMCSPHLVEKWSREVFITVPNARVFMVHDMRNGGDPHKRHGITEVELRDGKIIHRGWKGSLSDLRSMGRKGWKKFCPQPAWFIIGKEKGKLSYFWKHVYSFAKSGRNRGALVNVDSGDRVENAEGETLYTDNFEKAKRGEKLVRGRFAENFERPTDGKKMFSALWSADRTKIQRMAPFDYIGRYLPDWFDYSIADEVHELNGDTAQGNGLAVLERAARKNLALSGTICGGYADDLFRVMHRLDAPRMITDGFAWGHTGQRSFQETYGTIEEIRKVFPEDNRCSKATRAEVRVKRRPGVSPLLFGSYLMENTSFLFLEDISEALPGYEETVHAIEMSSEQRAAYEKLEKELKDAMKEYRGAGSSIVSLMLNALLLYPDHPYGIGPLKALIRNEDGYLERVQIAEPEQLDMDKLYPKEEWLINDIRKERREGRRVLVFATYTGKVDVTSRLQKVLEGAGFRVATLRSSVATDKRESWMQARVKEGVDVVLCHPRLVQTGLDLPAFPSIVFYECGYSLYTLRQASRRSWRIGQRKNVRVKFLDYSGTFQERCLRLMGKKLLVALSLEGKFSNEGLQDMADEDAGDILTALARELVSEAKVGESADAVWSALARQRQMVTSAPVFGVEPLPSPAPVPVKAPVAPEPVAEEPVEFQVSVAEFETSVPEPSSVSIELPVVTFDGSILARPDAFKQPKRRNKQAQAEAAGQLSLFELAGAA